MQNETPEGAIEPTEGAVAPGAQAWLRACSRNMLQITDLGRSVFNNFVLGSSITLNVLTVRSFRPHFSQHESANTDTHTNKFLIALTVHFRLRPASRKTPKT